jgi:hypothetical protein
VHGPAVVAGSCHRTLVTEEEDQIDAVAFDAAEGGALQTAGRFGDRSLESQEVGDLVLNDRRPNFAADRPRMAQFAFRLSF